MKFSCEKNLLIGAIFTAARAASTKSPVPLLEGLLIEAEGGTVKISGFDLKTGIVTTIQAEVEEAGGIVINARLLGEIIRKMPGSDISISVDSIFSAKITSEMSEFEILGSPATDYPELPTIEEKDSLQIDETTLKKMIAQTNFAVSDNESRPIHTGALFEAENGELTIVAVDGYRLALRREPIKSSKTELLSFVVPGVALNEVERIASDSENEISIILGAKHVMFSIGNTVLISRRLEGEFLNYKNSIPQEGKYQLKVDKYELIDAVERVSLIISDKMRSPVKCVFSEGILKLFSASALGKASDECAISGEIDELEIGFNDKYLLDALKAAPADELIMDLNTGVSPCVIRAADESNNFLYMILPVRLKAYED